MCESDVLEALKELVAKEGSQEAVAKKSGVQRSQISDYVRDVPTRDIKNMTLGTFFKLFPVANIDFFGKQQGNSIVSVSESSVMEERLLTYFRRLSPSEQADCLIIFGSKFGDSIKPQMKL